MCGIIGITRQNTNGSDKIGKMVYDALARLEYRGYDSVGIAVINPDKTIVRKDAGKISDVGDRLKFKELNGNLSIGHSRWATHGPPSKNNSHPHQSMNSKIVVVHNGIIENYIELRQELIDLGYIFQSQTDTEIIPHFLENEMNKGKNMLEAIVSLIDRIEGTYALVITHQDEPNRIYTLRKDNPLVLGLDKGISFCASDIPAFLPYTKEAIIMQDNEIAILEPGKIEIRSLPNLQIIPRKTHTVTWTAEAAQKGGYPHFMLKEIHEQSTVLGLQLASQKDIFPKIAKMIHEADKVVTVAAGTAYYASLNAFHTLPKFDKKIVLPTISAEWDTVQPLIDENTIILAVSQSGETLDTMKAVKDARSRNAKVASIVNVTGSSLTTISDKVAYIHAGPEIGVAATKTYSAQSLAVWRIARELAEMNGTLDNSELKEFDRVFEELPRAIDLTIERAEAKARDLATWFAGKHSSFYLGRGISHITALEGALKMKEISYIHAEAYPAGESKHGPIALVESDFPVVFTLPNDITRKKMIGSIQEMTARGATTIGIIEENDDELKSILHHHFEIPQGFSQYLTPITYNIPAQLLAYYTSVKRGANPDMPKNLAKSVTVE